MWIRFGTVIGTYGSAILICMAALTLGRGVCVLCGREGSTWLAPAVGLALLMALCQVAVRLPGHGWTGVVAVVLACAVAVWIGARKHAGWPALSDGLPVSLLVLGITTLPFLANGRVGVLGVSFLNDTSHHLILAEGLLHPAIQPMDSYGTGYPLGPHAIAAVFAQLLGTGVDKTLTGLLIATPVLTALSVLGALVDVTRARRQLVAVVSAMPYLAAAWYVQSAFKEPILSLLLLGMVLALQAGRAERFARPWAVAVPLAVLLAGVLYVYSYPGLLWPAGLGAAWLVVELILGGAWRHLRPVARWVRRSLPALGLSVGLLVLIVAPDIPRIRTFWLSNGGTSVGKVGGVTVTALANLAGPLHAIEGLDIWLTGDFRFPPGDRLQAGIFVGFALVVLIFALVRALERRELPWLGAMAAFFLIYIYALHNQSPYVAAKALTIPAPLLVMGSGAALMRYLDRADWRAVATWVVAAASVTYVVLVLQSEFLALRDAQVGPVNHTNELRALRPLLHGRPTLVLFYDDYTQWELLGVPVSSPLLGSKIPAPVQSAKPWSYGQPLDFDSMSAATLDKFDYVITTRTDAQSEPPPNFHIVGQSRSYEVWRRVGPTPPHMVLRESGQPGAVLDCSTPGGRRISRRRGYARIRPVPRYVTVSPLAAGGSERVVLKLDPGVWDLSLPFVSPQAVTVSGGGLNVWLPPNLDRPGEIWPVGRIVSDGAPITLTLRMSNPAPLSSGQPLSQFFVPEPMIAVPPVSDRTVPLRDACGRYVDWYVAR